MHDVVVHLVMRCPRGLGSVDIKTGPHTQIVLMGSVGHARAAGAGIRTDERQIGSGRPRLRSTFGHHIFRSAGEPRQEVSTARGSSPGGSYTANSMRVPVALLWCS